VRYYAGLDVSMKETFVCIMNEEGKKIYEGKSVSDPQPIYDELLKGGFELEKVGLETGSLSRYLLQGLQDLGVKAICIDARKMAAILSVTVNKTDKNDARGIADAMRCNHYKEVNINDVENSSTGILIKSRASLVHSRLAIKNTVRGLLKTFGIRLGEVSNTKFSKKVRETFVDILPHAKLGIESMIKVFEAMDEEIKKMDKSLKEIAKNDELARLLMTIPGVGVIVALTYKTDMGDPTRFEKSEAVGAYYGMTPKQYSSGETVKLGGISRCGSRNVRNLLVEAAIVMLTRSQAWSPLKAWGVKLAKKIGLKKAAVAVGRKLSIIMHRMLLTGETFRFSKVVAKAAA
jgi:transposase